MKHVNIKYTHAQKYKRMFQMHTDINVYHERVFKT